jgi:hypothetical protein
MLTGSGLCARKDRASRDPSRLGLLLGAGAILALLLLLGGPARADPPPSSSQALVGSDDRFREAFAHYDRGQGFFKREDFIAAALEFSQAHELFATVSREAAGTPAEAQAQAWDRTSLTDAATSYSRADAPVEAYDAFAQLKATFGAQMSATDLAAVDAGLERLAGRMGTLVVHGVPSDAELRVDGILVPGATKGPVRVAAGDHPMEVRGERYKTFARVVTVAPKQGAIVDVQMEKSDVVARLRMEASVAPASVKIDDTAAQPLPLERALSPGKHAYVVASEGYRPETGEFEVEPGERTLVRVDLIPKRTPLGLSIEAYFLFDALIRTDTPLNTNVHAGEDYSTGSPLSLGGGLRVFYQFSRFRALRLGVEINAVDRPIDAASFGTVVEFCPDATTWGTDRSAGWCPVTGAALLNVVPGQVNNFEGGEYSLRLGTKMERHFGELAFDFGAGLWLDTYKRSFLTSLDVASVYITAGVGFDL